MKVKHVNENDLEYRNKDSGPKYLIRGPNIDWGVILMKPGTKMGAHGHNEVEETFYFLSGEGNIYINDKAYPAKAGDVYYLEPKEKHDIENTGDDDMKLVFIKHPYLPDDKIKY
ncbi:MAG: cupin domain-containing protein [Candidatus Lokiarchaeota archaeon]|nr:cupin domain-containing protein [Candidatus Lokiarchaeota archaeon]